MSKKSNPTFIGAFVVGAIALAVTTVILLGGGKIFSDRSTYVTYFEGSIQGLRVGANVNFRGVRIGQVRRINVRFEESMLNFDLPVIIELEPGAIRTVTGGRIETSESGEMMKTLIEKGLRAKLEMESFVTGQLLIELDFHPGSTPIFRDPESEIQEIPTLPSDIALALENVQEFVAKLKGIPVEEVINNLTAAIDGIEHLVNSEELISALKGVDKLVNSTDTQQLSATLRDSIEKLDATVASVEKLVQRVDKRVDPLANDFSKSMQDIQLAVNEIETTFAEIRTKLKDETIRHEITTAVREFTDASRSFRTFVEYIERHPESFLSGKPGSQ